MTRSHRRQTTCSCSAEQVDENGLGLVVSGVAGHGVGRKCVISRIACSSLQVGAWLDTDDVHHEFKSEPFGDGCDDLDVAMRLFTQLVVDVVHGDVQSVCVSEQKKRHRVGATRDGERHRCRRNRKRAARQ